MVLYAQMQMQMQMQPQIHSGRDWARPGTRHNTIDQRALLPRASSPIIDDSQYTLVVSKSKSADDGGGFAVLLWPKRWHGRWHKTRPVQHARPVVELVAVSQPYLGVRRVGSIQVASPLQRPCCPKIVPYRNPLGHWAVYSLFKLESG